MQYHRFRKLFLAFILSTCIIVAFIFFLGGRTNLTLAGDHDFDCDDASLLSSIKRICLKGSPVFFVETSGSNTLSPRQACAVESTAYHNPSLQLYVLMTPSNSLADNNLMNKLHNISNVNLLKVSINDVVYGSPIFKWFHSGIWNKSQWKISHLSDALRFLLLWKFGGIYLDLDVVTLRPLDHLRNSIITEDWKMVASAILFFDRHHELMRRCVYEFADKYNPHSFGGNGPGILTNNLKQFCGTKVISKISESSCDVNVLPPEAAFPIYYNNYQQYFVRSFVKNINSYFNNSFLIHVWNTFSKNARLKINDNSLYEMAIKENCPIVYDYIKALDYV